MCFADSRRDVRNPVNPPTFFEKHCVCVSLRFFFGQCAISIRFSKGREPRRFCSSWGVGLEAESDERMEKE